MAHVMRTGDRVRRVNPWMFSFSKERPQVGDLGTVVEIVDEHAVRVLFDRLRNHNAYGCTVNNLCYIGMRVNPEKL